MATLLPVPEQQWIDSNGVPIAGGTVAFYVPNTMTPKDTYKDSGGATLNTNPVVLDSAGRAIIYGTGTYRAIVKDADGNLIYDQLTTDTAVGGLAFGGTSTGTPNAQVIAASSFTQQDGQQVSFIIGTGLTNTGGTTVTLGGGSGISILKDTVSGPTPLTGGELVAGNSVTLLYDATRGAFQLVSYPLNTTPGANSITNAMLAQAPADTFKGNNTGSTANVADMTAVQAAAILPAFTGDSGSGGVKGLVPAPGSGTGAAQDYLGADATWHPAPIGVGQSWQTPSRAVGTSYQNSTGRPIAMIANFQFSSGQSASLSTGSASASLEIDNLSAGGGAAISGSLRAIIPPGWFYEVAVTGSPTLNFWVELR